MKKILFVFVSLVMSLTVLAYNDIDRYYEKINLEHKYDSLCNVRNIIVEKELKNNNDTYSELFTYIDLNISINSAGGTGPSFYFCNTSTQTFKYLKIIGYFVNGVNDKIKSKISFRNSYMENYEITGPINPGDCINQDSDDWETLFYNYSAKKFIPTSITIVFMNNTQKTFSGTTLKTIIQKSIDKFKNDLNVKLYETSAFDKINNEIAEVSNALDNFPKDMFNIMPIFNNGGDEGFINFILKNIIYSDNAIKILNSNKQKTIVLKFSVNENNEPFNIKVLTPICSEFDNEIIRVVKLSNGMWTGGYVLNTKTNKIEYGEYYINFKTRPHKTFEAEQQSETFQTLRKILKDKGKL